MIKRPVGRPDYVAAVVAPSDPGQTAVMDRRADLLQTVARTPRPRGVSSASGREPSARQGRNLYPGRRRMRPSDLVDHLPIVIGTWSRHPVRVIAVSVLVHKAATPGFS